MTKTTELKIGDRIKTERVEFIAPYVNAQGVRQPDMYLVVLGTLGNITFTTRRVLTHANYNWEVQK